jgi:hypothetical protein
VTQWPKTVAKVCDDYFNPHIPRRSPVTRTVTPKYDDAHISRVMAHAKLTMLRSAYFTVMLRAAGELGPGCRRVQSQ